jgi:LiaI-LiaF-like transmembrane region
MNVNEANLIRAIRGPITLITVGVLFAIDHFTPYGFSQTWPVLLIVFGLLSLAGRSSRSAGRPAGSAGGAGGGPQ